MFLEQVDFNIRFLAWSSVFLFLLRFFLAIVHPEVDLMPAPVVHCWVGACRRMESPVARGTADDGLLCCLAYRSTSDSVIVCKIDPRIENGICH